MNPPLSCQNHRHLAVQTTDIHVLGCPDRVAAAGADIFPGTGCFGRQCGGGTAVGSGACDPIAVELIPVDQDVAQIVVQTELQETVAGTGDRPPVLVVVFHDQAAGFGAVPELAVVVGATSGAILNAVDEVVVVNHLMQKRGANLLDGSRKGTGSDVDLMGAAQFGNPRVLPEGEVAVGLGRGLDGDGGS